MCIDAKLVTNRDKDFNPRVKKLASNLFKVFITIIFVYPTRQKEAL